MYLRLFFEYWANVISEFIFTQIDMTLFLLPENSKFAKFTSCPECLILKSRSQHIFTRFLGQNRKQWHTDLVKVKGSGRRGPALLLLLLLLSHACARSRADFKISSFSHRFSGSKHKTAKGNLKCLKSKWKWLSQRIPPGLRQNF